MYMLKGHLHSGHFNPKIQPRTFQPQTFQHMNLDETKNGLRTPGEEIAFTAWPKINSQSQHFLGTAEAYIVCHIGPKFQISWIYAFIGFPVVRASTPWFKSLGLESSWLKSLGLKLWVEKSMVEI